MQPAMAAQQHQQHDPSAMAHGAAHAQALFSSGFGGGGGGLPVMRAASLHQQHQYSSGMGGGGEAVVMHTRSIHAAVLPQRFESAGGGGGMATPGRGGTPAPHPRNFGGSLSAGGGLMHGRGVHGAQPAGASSHSNLRMVIIHALVR